MRLKMFEEQKHLNCEFKDIIKHLNAYVNISIFKYRTTFK